EERAVSELFDRAELRQDIGLLVADELAAEPSRTREVGGALHVGLLAARARHLAVLFHQLAEAIDIDRLTALFRELDGQLDREAERRGKHERVLAGDRALAGELLELLQAAGERLAEALLLEPHDVLDLLRVVP